MFSGLGKPVINVPGHGCCSWNLEILGGLRWFSGSGWASVLWMSFSARLWSPCWARGTWGGVSPTDQCVFLLRWQGPHATTERWRSRPGRSSLWPLTPSRGSACSAWPGAQRASKGLAGRTRSVGCREMKEKGRVWPSVAETSHGPLGKSLPPGSQLLLCKMQSLKHWSLRSLVTIFGS